MPIFDPPSPSIRTRLGYYLHRSPLCRRALGHDSCEGGRLSPSRLRSSFNPSCAVVALGWDFFRRININRLWILCPIRRGQCNLTKAGLCYAQSLSPLRLLTVIYMILHAGPSVHKGRQVSTCLEHRYRTAPEVRPGGRMPSQKVGLQVGPPTAFSVWKKVLTSL